MRNCASEVWSLGPSRNDGVWVASLAMTSNPQATSRSRRDAPELCIYLSPQGGRGECRVPAAPAASCAIIVIERTRVTTSTPESPGIPARMVLTVFFVLSPVTGLFCHRRPTDRFCLSPVGPTQLRELDASVGASGPHDFAVRELHLSSARRSIAHRLAPALPSRTHPTLPRPPHPTPRP